MKKDIIRYLGVRITGSWKMIKDIKRHYRELAGSVIKKRFELAERLVVAVIVWKMLMMMKIPMVMKKMVMVVMMMVMVMVIT